MADRAEDDRPWLRSVDDVGPDAAVQSAPAASPGRDRRWASPVPRTFHEQVEMLYRLDGDRLWRSIFGLSASRTIADDAVAEAFAQLLRRGDAVRDPRAWVWRTAYRLALGLLSERNRTVNEVLDDLAYEAPEPALDLVAALRELSPAQRSAVIFVDFAGYRARETADLIGSSEAAVRVHLMRGRRRLRARLGEES